jgi:hypothetical protein
MSTIRDVVLNPSKINLSTHNAVNYNYCALLWQSHIVIEDGFILGQLATSSSCTSKVQPAVDVRARSELVKWRLQVLGCC